MKIEYDRIKSKICEKYNPCNIYSSPVQELQQKKDHILKLKIKE